MHLASLQTLDQFNNVIVIVGVCCYSLHSVNFHVYFVPVFCYIQRFVVFSLISSVNRVYLFWPKYLIVAQSPISHLMTSKSPVKIKIIIIFIRTSHNPQFLIRIRWLKLQIDLVCPVDAFFLSYQKKYSRIWSFGRSVVGYYLINPFKPHIFEHFTRLEFRCN